MASRIVFNGKPYDSVDAMPADVREAYQRALELFADRNQNGTPDILEGKGPATVVTVEHSGSFTWKGAADSLRATELAGDLIESTRSPKPSEDVFEPTRRVLGGLGMVLVAAAAAAVLIAGVLMIVTMDAGSSSQGGQFYVGVGMLFVLGWLLNMYLSFRNRR